MPSSKPILPPEALVDIHFPIQGVDISQAFDTQRPKTTPLGQNVRAFEPGTARARGGARSGLVQYIPSPVNGTNYLQELTLIISTPTTATPPGPPVPPTPPPTPIVTLGTTTLVQGPNQGQAVMLDGYGNALYTLPQPTGYTDACLFYDPATGNGIIGVAQNATTSAIDLYCVLPTGMLLWSNNGLTSKTPASSSSPGVMGLASSGTTLYVLYPNSSPASASVPVIGTINLTTGVTLNAAYKNLSGLTVAGGKLNLTVPPGITRRSMAVSNGFLAVVGNIVVQNGLSFVARGAGIVLINLTTGATSYTVAAGISTDALATVTADAVGNFYATGTVTTGSTPARGVVSFTSAGAVRWKQLVNNANLPTDVQYDVTSGNLYVAGSSPFGTSGNFSVVNATTGALIGTSTVTGGGAALTTDRNGILRFSTNAAAAAYQYSTTTQVWLDTITGTGTSVASY